MAAVRLVGTRSLITWLMAPLISCHMLSTEMKEELKNFTLLKNITSLPTYLAFRIDNVCFLPFSDSVDTKRVKINILYLFAFQAIQQYNRTQVCI